MAACLGNIGWRLILGSMRAWLCASRLGKVWDDQLVVFFSCLILVFVFLAVFVFLVVFVLLVVFVAVGFLPFLFFWAFLAFGFLAFVGFVAFVFFPGQFVVSWQYAATIVQTASKTSIGKKKQKDSK